jgi:hypothetical protein
VTADPVAAIARAVLYEGYVLWPYRRSALKNAQRFTFGSLYLWDGVNDEPLWEYTSLSGKITEFRFSADSQRLLCLCNEDQLVILDGSPMEDRP